MQFVDLSVPLDNDRHWAPWWARNRVKRQDHKAGRMAIWLLFRLTPRYLRNRLGWANDTIHLSTHGTTHVDAPWHYGPLCEGQPAKTIDQVPLEWCYGPGVVLDVTHKQDFQPVTEADVRSALDKIQHTLAPGEIVLMHTGNDRFRGTPEYFTRGTGMSAEATRRILNQGVKLTGIDSWGWDVPLPNMAAEAKRTGRDDLFWEAHYVGQEHEYCHIERLTNLHLLPPRGFTLCAFPLKVAGGSAGPSRVVALVPDEISATS